MNRHQSFIEVNNPYVRDDTYTIARSSGDRNFLYWLRARLVTVYGEDEYTDFVQTLHSFADNFVPENVAYSRGRIHGIVYGVLGTLALATTAIFFIIL